MIPPDGRLTEELVSEDRPPRDACGVFGVWAPGEDVAKLAYFGLYALQHRGQESAGIAVSDGSRIVVHKEMGLVAQVFDEPALTALRGHIAVGHCRYSTTGASVWANAQPTFRSTGTTSLALGHNGNLINTRELAALLGGAGPGSAGIVATSDTDVLTALFVSDRAALNVAAEQVIEYSAYGALLQRAGNRGPTAAPQNPYRTADIDEFGCRDSWVAVAVTTDEQWLGLCDALGCPPWAMDPKLSSAAGRREQHDVIDEHLAAWCAQRGGDEIVRILWGAGVPVGKVMQPHRQTELPQLAFRGFFEDVGHPVNDRARHSTIPMRFSGGPHRFHVHPAPLLGQHNHELLAELGLTEAEIAGLEADGVIGRAPAMYDSTTAT